MNSSRKSADSAITAASRGVVWPSTLRCANFTSSGYRATRRSGCARCTTNTAGCTVTSTKSSGCRVSCPPGAGAAPACRRRRRARRRWSTPRRGSRGTRPRRRPRRPRPAGRAAGGPRGRRARRRGRRRRSSRRPTHGVSAVPGFTALTRMPSRRWSAAMARVSDSDRALARAVERALGQSGRRRDRAGVDDRRRGGLAQVRQRGPGDPDHADDVDVEHPVPLVVGVVLDRALRADAGVVDEMSMRPSLGRRGRPPRARSRRRPRRRRSRGRPCGAASGCRSKTATRAPPCGRALGDRARRCPTRRR